MALGIPMACYSNEFRWESVATKAFMMTDEHLVNDAPIAIIGGGLAGSSAATILAKAGWNVNLLERDSFPRNKLCGEFLSGESGRLLDRLGCLSILQSQGIPVINNVRFITRRGRTVDVALPESAFGISRRLLDETLFRHACASGAHGFTDCEVRSVVPGQRKSPIMIEVARGQSVQRLSPALTIGAYGRRTKLDRDLHRPFLKNLSGTVGLKLHHRALNTDAGKEASTALASTTEIYVLDGGYCGLCTVEGGLINVCMLLQKRAFAKIRSAKWPDVMTFLKQDNQSLHHRLSGLQPCDEDVCTVSQMPFIIKDQADDDVLFVGDAAGMIAPLCGDGQAMALEGGMALADLIIEIFPEPNTVSRQSLAESLLAERWQAQWREKFSERMHIGRGLQYVLLRPTITELAAMVFGVLPSGAANYLAKVTRSHG